MPRETRTARKARGEEVAKEEIPRRLRDFNEGAPMAENDNVNGIGANPNAQPDDAVVAGDNNAAAGNGANGNAPGDAAAALAAAAAAAQLVANQGPPAGPGNAAPAGNVPPAGGPNPAPTPAEQAAAAALLAAVPAGTLQRLLASALQTGAGPAAPAPAKTTSVIECKIPTFCGRKDDRAAYVWLQKAEAIKIQANWDDNQFLQAMTSAMTKEADTWLNYMRTQQADNNGVGALSSVEDFKAAFLKYFDKRASQIELATNVASLKMQNGEDVMSFYMRVENAVTEWVHNYFDKKKWRIIGPDANGRGGNDNFYRQQGVLDFGKTSVRDTFFLHGLPPMYAQFVSANIGQLDRLNMSMLDAALEYERSNTRGGRSQPQILGLNHYEQPDRQPRWQTPSNRGRGRGQARGRGFNSRGGRGGGSNSFSTRETGYDKLSRIQNRQKPVHCKRCHQWGKHYTNECRRPWNQVAAMDFQDPSTKPKGAATDSFYDNLQQWPGDDLPEDPPGEGHNSSEAMNQNQGN